MISEKFEYQRASSVDEAIQLLAANSGGAKILAGGHSLLPAMKLRLNSPDKLIDISRISELRYIRQDGNMLAIGAATTHGDIEHSEMIREAMPMLAEAAGLIGDPAVRNKGTIAGSLAHADPAADWPACMLAANAVIVLRGANGEREVSAEDFFQGFFMTALNEDELITEIKIPLHPEGTGKLVSAYQKFMQPASRFAIVGCAVVMRIDRGPSCTYARVALTGVSDKAFRDLEVEQALVNNILKDDLIKEVASKAAEGVDILSDHFASEAYRKHLAKVYVKRAIQSGMDNF